MNEINYFSPELLKSMNPALESMSSFSKSGATSFGGDNWSLIGTFSQESVGKLNALMSAYKTFGLSSGHITQKQAEDIYMENLNNGIEKFVKECTVSNKRFGQLPTEVQAIMKPLQNMKTAVENKLDKLSEADNRSVRFALNFEKKQVENAMEKVLFGICSNLIDREINANPFAPAMESGYSYQQTIPYPKLEAPVQWVNSAATVYPKVAKVKSLLNPFTSVVIHSQEIWYVPYDENNIKQLDKAVKREDLFSVMDPAKAGFDMDAFFGSQTRELTVLAQDFNKILDFQKSEIYNPENNTLTTGGAVKTGSQWKTGTDLKAFLGADEQVRSDFRITGIAVAGEPKWATQELYDLRSGKVLADAFAEMYDKGKVLPWEYAPGKIYFISLLWDGQPQHLTVSVSKSDNSMPNIEAIKFEFKLNDLFNQFKTRLDIEIRTRRTVLSAGAVVRKDIPNLAEHFSIIDERQGGSILTKLTNLTAEKSAHEKEYVWFKGYTDMTERLAEEYKVTPYTKNSTTLYCEMATDLDIKGEVNKDQAIRYALGNALRGIKAKLDIRANSNIDVQTNMLGHTASLLALDNFVTPIVGTVNEESNGQFLGVAQQARTSVLTLGTDTNNPVNSVVVGTDKNDMSADPYATTPVAGTPITWKAPEDVEYMMYVIPEYKETNLETHMLVETPTKVQADGNFRSARRPFVPNIQIEYTAKYFIARESSAKFFIKGINVHYAG